uniref:von Willebrand factor, type A n=1 Tax=Solibacter usitatus (strain Ellin6076) TaxID=234267 RepID=Q01XW6_SOLUE
MTISPVRRSRKSGSVMVLITLLLPSIMIPLVGLAIDASVARLVQLRLQAAVDGAAMGAGRLLGTPAVPETLAAEFLASNFRTDGSAGTWGAHDLHSTIVYTPGITKIIDIDATAQVPLLFLRILGKTSATVRARGSGTRTDSRVMLVIDRSGTMDVSDGTGLPTRIENAKTVAQTLFIPAFTEGADEIGLVAFDGSAYVAYPPSQPGWDPTTTSSSRGGPDMYFKDPNNPNNMINQVNAIDAGSYTGTAEALWMAYIELQKAHLKDLAQDGVDLRMNSILLLTDGLPQALAVSLNTTGSNVLKATSPCTNRVGPPNKPAMVGFVTGGPSTTARGIYRLYSLDPTSAHTSLWWGANPGQAVDTGLTANCSGLSSAGSFALNTTDLTKIPDVDMWGNATTGTAYKTVSRYIDKNGHTITNQIPTSTNYSGTPVSGNGSGDQWLIAMWNATDSAATRIRTDANKNNRTPSDPNNMRVSINVIGYVGQNGLDEGLLIRIANSVPSATYPNASYDSTQPSGLYCRASDSATLAQSFFKIVTAILRLAS